MDFYDIYYQERVWLGYARVAPGVLARAPDGPSRVVEEVLQHRR
jgi:hypothetical protein